MGFLNNIKPNSRKVNKFSLTAKTFGCKVCTLNRVQNKSPNMPPSGTNEPIFYFLGEAPGGTEDEYSEHFVGDSGKILRNILKNIVSTEFINKFIRWNNSVRCRPHENGSNRKPTQLEIECCRQSLVEDIERTKPLVVVGFGDVPLKNLTFGKQIGMWRGRFTPIKVGNHVCWFFGSYHPSFLLRRKGFYESEYDKCFKADLRSVIDFVRNEYVPPTYIESDFDKGITCLLDKSTSFVKETFSKLKNLDRFTVDIETNRLKPYYPDSFIASISVGTDEEVLAIPFGYPNYWNSDQFMLIKQYLFDLLTSGKPTKIAHNLKFELEWFYKLFSSMDILKSKWADTMLQAYILDERTSKEEGMLSLDSLVTVNFGFTLKDKTTVDRKNIMKSKLRDILIYNGMDVKFTHKLDINQMYKLNGKNLDNYKRLVETTKTLVLVQNNGVFIDLKELEKFSNNFQNLISEKERDIILLPEAMEFEKMFNRKVDILSNDDLIIIFRDILKFDEEKQTKKSKKTALDKEVMKLYETKYNSKLAKYVEEYRTLNKIKSTYIDNARNNLVDDNIVHPQFNIIGTQTGRFSSGKDIN